MNIVGRVRKSVNVTASAFDDELRDVVEAARHEMIMSGVPPHIARNDEISGVVQAIKCYVKADQAWEEPSVAQGQMQSFTSLVNKLAMTYGDGRHTSEGGFVHVE